MSSTSSAADGAQTAPAAAGSSTGLSAQEQEWKDDPELAFETGVELAFERWDVLNVSHSFAHNNHQSISSPA